MLMSGAELSFALTKLQLSFLFSPRLQDRYINVIPRAGRAFVTDNNVALLSLILIVLQSSSFVFAWLCIVLRCWLLLSLLFV